MARAAAHDADLDALAACADGKETGLAELYGRHAASCFGLALSILRDRDYAQDAVQEAYISLWRQPERFDSRQSSVRSWLLLMTRSRAIDRVRHEERRKAFVLPVDHDIEDERPGPEGEAVAASIATEVRAALRTLSPVKQEALVLAYWGGYTQREIAELTHTALGTVKSRMMSAMIDLRQALDTRELERDGSRLVSAQE